MWRGPVGEFAALRWAVTILALNYMEQAQINAVGLIIRGTIKEDDVAVNVSTCTTKQIILRKPNGAVLTKTAVFTTDGINGQVQYLTQTGDLDVAGSWSAQAYVIFPGGFDGRSEVEKFWVNSNL